LNNWDSLFIQQSKEAEFVNTVEDSLNSILQGRLLEIGNIRGYHTYCPNKSKIFNC